MHTFTILIDSFVVYIYTSFVSNDRPSTEQSRLDCTCRSIQVTAWPIKLQLRIRIYPTAFTAQDTHTINLLQAIIQASITHTDGWICVLLSIQDTLYKSNPVFINSTLHSLNTQNCHLSYGQVCNSKARLLGASQVSNNWSWADISKS